jgi:putative exosortase-associated protein (TIGR04073 family)
MKYKISTIICILVLLAGSATMSLADTKVEPYPGNLEEKLGAGLLNSVTGWLELVKTPMALSKKDGLGWGLTLGLPMGVFNAIGRTSCGLFDVVTFILPTKPMVKPNMIWQDFDTETTYNTSFETYDH